MCDSNIMSDELEESSEIPVNLTIGDLYNDNNLNVLNKLQELCVRRTHQLSLDIHGLNNNSIFEFKFKNCHELLFKQSKHQKKTKKLDGNNFVELFFKFVKRSFGISQIVGSSGSGKTSICLTISKKIPGIVLYLDISGSFDRKRAPSGKNFIPLRLYTLDELTLFLNDFERRLRSDTKLCEVLDVKASSVEMLIIDSLWCVDQIDKFHRHEYLFNLSLILRRLSWKYNINVIVCINHTHKFNKLMKKFDNFTNSINKDTRGTKGTYGSLENKRKDMYSKWNSNCYVKFILNYKNLNYNINHLSKDKIDVPLVYRIMQINTGTLSKIFKFSITDDNILLEDI